MTPLQYKMLKAIKDGSFAFCHLYARFNCNISYEQVKKDLCALKNLGHIHMYKTDDGDLRFGITRPGCKYMTSWPRARRVHV